MKVNDDVAVNTHKLLWGRSAECWNQWEAGGAKTEILIM